MRSNVSRETIWCLRTGVSRETFGPFAVSSGTPRAARSRCPSFAACGGGTRGRSARRAGRAGGARGARGGRASRRVRREWARFSIGLTTGWQAGWQRLHAMHDYLGPSSKAQEENPGRKKRRWRRIVHSVQSLPCGDVREAARAGARATSRRAYATTGSTLHPASTRPIISREAIGRLRANISREASWPRAGAACRKIARGRTRRAGAERQRA